MSLEHWKQQATWAAMVGAILLTGAAAQAESGDAKEDQQTKRVHVETEAAHRYWIGLAVRPAEPALRSQLKLGDEGLLVDRVAPESPADNADIEQGDILLKAGDKSLQQLGDLVEAVANSEGKAISLSLLRAGERKSVDVTPAKRDDEDDDADRPMPGEGEDIDVRRLIGRAREMAPQLADRLTRDFIVMRPGLPIEIELPADMKVTIEKEGDKPGKVTVKRGDKTWEVTDKTLGELPDEARAFVEAYLGKIPSPPLPPELKGLFEGRVPLPPPGVIPPPEEVEEHLRREGARIERRLGEEALPRLRDLQDRLRDVERRVEERLRDVEKRVESIDSQDKDAAHDDKAHGDKQDHSKKDGDNKDSDNEQDDNADKA
jgi:membrane-associated protease RseP (regulator of RpoE activity)